MKDSFEHLHKLIVSHSVDRSPKYVKVFDVNDAELIIDYMLNTYYRHYKWYSYVFTQQVCITINQINPVKLFLIIQFNVLTPSYFRPLQEAIPLEINDKEPEPEPINQEEKVENEVIEKNRKSRVSKTQTNRKSSISSPKRISKN